MLLLPASGLAADLPPIRASAANPVAECATPGRMMVFLRSLNPKLDPRYGELGSHYMRHGEALGLRWDYAFFQMLLETGHLTYKGDVKADQNNFAGLGATGKGARGERFPDIETGVRAHLEHVRMYSGEPVENPVAERTRNIQEWGVLTKWQQGFSRPITFSDLSKKWAPGSRRYARDIQSIAERFFTGPCLEPDPQPELVAQIRGTGGKAAAKQTAAQTRTAASETAKSAPSQTLPLAAKTSTASDDGGALSSGYSAGAARMVDTRATVRAESKPDTADVKTGDARPQVQTASMSPSVKVLNAPVADAKEPDTTTKPDASKDASTSASAKKKSDGVEVAALAGSGAAQATATKKAAEAPKAPSKKGSCRVWTASYGGTKAIIIKAVKDTTTNYTVLDVNEGAEKREADAYINAYAKGGTQVGEFSSPSLALEKAFELCPEG